MKLATIELVTAVTPHSNADALDFVHVLGYDCIVSRGSFAVGDRVVLIQPDAVLPNDRAWCAEALKYTSRGRVKAARLRGQWSMGLVMPLSTLPFGLSECAEGIEVSEQLGVTKYEPPPPRNQDAKGGLPFGIPKTDEDRWQNIRDLRALEGELVDVTLKIDGSSFTAFCVLPADSGQAEVATGICSRSLEMKMDEGATNQWLEVARMTNVVARLRDYCLDRGVSLAIRGEVAELARPLPVTPREVWTVAGSGTLARALQRAWPGASFHAVRIGAAPDVGAATVHVAPERFERDAKAPPPFPSCSNYDAKAWQFIRRHASPGALFWNVAA